MFCRCRYDDSDMCALTFDGDERVICTTVQGRKKVFEFEKMYAPETSQETVSIITQIHTNVVQQKKVPMNSVDLILLY